MRKTQTEPYLSAYLYSKGCKLGLPIGGNFEITSRCNFRCPMCYVHHAADTDIASRELTAQQWISLATQARDLGMVFALLTGGEPFIRQDFFDIYRGFAKLGIYLSINTNGSLITKEVRQELLKNPPVRMNISLYGTSNDTYRKMCGQASFDQVMENIIALKESGIDVRLNHSITPNNRKDLAQIYAISRELNLHVKAASYMYPPVRIQEGQFGCGNRLSPEEAAQSAVEWDILRLDEAEFMNRAEGVAKLCAVDRSECAVEMDDGIGCRAGRSSFWLTWEGKMLPCGMMPWVGADPVKDGFAAAWQKTLEYTKQIHRPKECLQCPKKEVCSICAAVCVTETGAFDRVPEYVCHQTDAFIEKTRQEYENRKG